MHNNAGNILEKLNNARLSAILNDMKDDFLNQYSFTKIMTGFELEFYLSQKPSQKMIDEIMQIDGILEFKKELGENQFEITTIPQSGCIKSCEIVENIKVQLRDICNKNKIDIIFEAFINDNTPPSSLQMSISFYDDETPTSLKNPKFYNIINSIIDNIAQTIFITSPTENCFKRISNRNLAEKFKNSPTHTTWGTENRTVSVRVAKIPDCDNGNRLEFRTPSPLANGYHVALILIASASCQSSKKYEQTFINSYLMCENALPQSMSEAKKLFLEGKIAKKIEFYYEKHAI